MLELAASILFAGTGVATSPLIVEIAGEGCPSEDAFRADAEQRMQSRGDPMQTVSVKLGPSTRGFAGTVDVIDARGAVVASRTVEATTCTDVASAALLLAALSSPEGRDADAPRPAVSEPRAIEADRSPSAAAHPVSASDRARFRFHIAVVGAVAGGVGPMAAGGGARLGAGIERRSVFRPELGVLFERYGDADIANGDASRSIWTARADLCPIGFGPSYLTVHFCGAAALGEVRVRGEAIRAAKDEGRLYAAIGGVVRTRVPIVSGLGAEIGIGAVAPLYRHTFVFEPNVTVLALAPGLLGEAGLSWSIP